MENLKKDYADLFKKVMKRQWEKGQYDINSLSKFKRNASNPPSLNDINTLQSILNELQV